MHIFTGCSIPIPCSEEKTGRVKAREKRREQEKVSHWAKAGGEGRWTNRKEEKEGIKLSNKPILLDAFNEWSLGGDTLARTDGGTLIRITAFWHND